MKEGAVARVAHFYYIMMNLRLVRKLLLNHFQSSRFWTPWCWVKLEFCNDFTRVFELEMKEGAVERVAHFYYIMINLRLVRKLLYIYIYIEEERRVV